MNAPRDGLVRANLNSEASKVEGRTMVGYPIVFDRWTTINSWEGNFKERIAPSALNQTLRTNAKNVKVLFNHGMDPSIGDKPLGKPSVMRADEQGLYAEVVLSETSYNDDLLALMRDGAIDGQSFRFSVVQEEWDKVDTKLPERTITELRLYEFGPVTFPAYEATTIGIRSRETFADWLGLDEERRIKVAHIMGVDLRTLGHGAADGTPTPGAAPQETPEPLGAHSGDPARLRRAHAAAYGLQELFNNARRESSQPSG